MQNLVITAVAILLALSLALANAHGDELPTHPFVGLSQVCIAAPGAQPSCMSFKSRQDFDTHDACAAYMEHALEEFEARVKHADPRLGFDARFMCVEDHDQYNS